MREQLQAQAAEDGAGRSAPFAARTWKRVLRRLAIFPSASRTQRQRLQLYVTLDQAGCAARVHMCPTSAWQTGFAARARHELVQLREGGAGALPGRVGGPEQSARLPFVSLNGVGAAR